MTWFEDVKGLKDTVKKDMEANSRYLVLPKSGETKSYLLRLKMPDPEVKDFEGKPKKEYVWKACDDKLLGTSEKLTLKMLDALEKVRSHIDADKSSDVVFDISREGTGKGTVWFVVAKAGV